MSASLGLRKSGARQRSNPLPRDLIGPSLGLTSGEHPGEKRLNYKQVVAIEQLFNSHPAVQAARTIIHGQLLSGGIVLRRDGQDVELKPAFKRHLDETWVPFAQSVVDSFLKFGYAAVVYEEDESSLMSMSRKRQRGATGQAGSAGKASETQNIIPIVPPTDTYEIAYAMVGRGGYMRKYFLYGKAPSTATRIDDEARVIVRQHPDPDGNLNSPMATIFDLGSFTSALTELAITAEITNTKPRIWTQMQKEVNKGGLDPQGLFFDSESRQLAASNDTTDNAQQASALALQQQLCGIINKLQTTNPGSGLDVKSSSFSGTSQEAGKFAHLPPEVPPTLFCLPKARLRSRFQTLVACCALFYTVHVCLFSGSRGRQRRPAAAGQGRLGGAAAARNRELRCSLWSARRPDVQRAVRVQVDIAVSRAPFQPCTHYR